MVGTSSLLTEKETGWPVSPVYCGLNVSLRCPAEMVSQRTWVTPVIAKPAGGGGGGPAGLTVMRKTVLTDKLPGSVAVTVTSDTPDTLGVPLMVDGAEKFSPAGNPLTCSVNPLGVWASVNVLAGIPKLNA